MSSHSPLYVISENPWIFFFSLSPIHSKLPELCLRLPMECVVLLHTPYVPKCIHFLHSAPPELSSMTTFLSILCPLSALCSQAFCVSQLCVCVCTSHLCIVAGLSWLPFLSFPPSDISYCPQVCLSKEQWGS